MKHKVDEFLTTSNTHNRVKDMNDRWQLMQVANFLSCKKDTRRHRYKDASAYWYHIPSASCLRDASSDSAINGTDEGCDGESESASSQSDNLCKTYRLNGALLGEKYTLDRHTYI